MCFGAINCPKRDRDREPDITPVLVRERDDVRSRAGPIDVSKREYRVEHHLLIIVGEKARTAEKH